MRFFLPNIGLIARSLFNRIGSVLSAPANTATPTIDNIAPRVGDTVTGTPGTWTGSPTLSYQWAATDGTPISGANSIAYTVQQSDASYGQGIKLIETASNGAGSASADSAATATIPPFNITPPQLADDGAGGGSVDAPVDGSAAPGPSDNLSITGDSWTSVDFFTYQWSFATGSGGGIPGTSPTQSCNNMGFGGTLICAVTAHKNGATTTVNTNPSGPITGI